MKSIVLVIWFADLKSLCETIAQPYQHLLIFRRWLNLEHNIGPLIESADAGK